MSDRKIIYSALVGNYDDIPNYPINVPEDWELILFTDQTTDAYVNGWQILPLKYIVKDDNVRTNRWHKINSHLLFTDCLCSIYIDCNILILDDFLFKRVLALIAKNTAIALINHPSRICVYDEAEACIGFGKDLKSNIQQNVDFLKNENYPKNNGLFENNLIFRNHTINQVQEINKLWWSILSKMARRDQLSLVYVLWKLQIEPDYFLNTSKQTLRNHSSFKYIVKHKINNNKFELTEVELLDRIATKTVELENKINKIKKSISYKIFYKIERSILKLLKK